MDKLIRWMLFLIVLTIGLIFRKGQQKTARSSHG